jgi:serine/threonine-protein kinase
LGLDFEAMGDFMVLNELGRGGMGIVYRAVHRPTGRVCALKRIISDFVRNEHACRLFEREITVQSEVQHPNLVTLLGQGRAGITPILRRSIWPGGDEPDGRSRSVCVLKRAAR